MYTTKVDDEISLALTLPSFSEELFNIVNNNRDEFGKWFPWVKHTENSDDTKEFIQSCIEDLANNKHLHNTIIYKSKVVGVVDIRLNIKNFKGDIGYWLDSEYWGKGIMSRTVKKFVEICFREYNLEKITIHCDTQNCASCKVAESAGFQKEALLKKHLHVNGEQRDFYRYTIFKE